MCYFISNWHSLEEKQFQELCVHLIFNKRKNGVDQDWADASTICWGKCSCTPRHATTPTRSTTSAAISRSEIDLDSRHCCHQLSFHSLHISSRCPAEETSRVWNSPVCFYPHGVLFVSLLWEHGLLPRQGWKEHVFWWGLVRKRQVASVGQCRCNLMFCRPSDTVSF